MSHVACSPDCAIKWAEKQREKRQVKAAKESRKIDQERRRKLKTVSELAKEAERLVNKYVRLRDAKDGCISCEKGPYWDGQWHASHYKSVGSNSALRFNLWNIHKACSICNNWLSGNIGAFKPNLILKIGAERVEWLDNHPRSREYSREYLERLKRIFSKKIRRIESRIKLH